MKKRKIIIGDLAEWSEDRKLNIDVIDKDDSVIISAMKTKILALLNSLLHILFPFLWYVFFINRPIHSYFFLVSLVFIIGLFLFRLYSFIRTAKGQNNVEIDFKNNNIVIDNHNFLGQIIFRRVKIKCSNGNSVSKKRISYQSETYRLILHTENGNNYPLINIDKDFGSDKFVTGLDYLVKGDDE